MPDNRLEFQGVCFVASAGHLWMKGYFDYFPPEVRERLRNSPFNMCAACLRENAIIELNDGLITRDYLKAIEMFEKQIIAKEGPFGPQPVNPAPLVAKPRRQCHV